MAGLLALGNSLWAVTVRAVARTASALRIKDGMLGVCTRLVFARRFLLPVVRLWRDVQPKKLFVPALCEDFYFIAVQKGGGAGGTTKNREGTGLIEVSIVEERNLKIGKRAVVRVFYSRRDKSYDKSAKNHQ